MLGTGNWEGITKIRPLQEVSEPRGTLSQSRKRDRRYLRDLRSPSIIFFSRLRTLSTVHQILSPHSWRHSTLNTPEDTPLHTQPPNTTTCSVVLHGLFLTLTLTRTPASSSMLPLKVHSDILVPRVKLTKKHYFYL